jgi:hypothetical protein
MLRAFGVFLSVFWMLSMVVQLPEMVYLFGASAVALLALDLLMRSLRGSRAPKKYEGRPL